MKIIDLIASQAGLARFASFIYCSRSTASLAGTQTKYTKKDIYEDYKVDGKTIQGIKVNKNDGSLKIFGLVTSKVQITPPVTPYKEVKSAPLTIEKNKITKTLPIGRFREFALDNLAMAKLNGETLVLE